MRVPFLRVFAVALIPCLLQESATAYLNLSSVTLERSQAAHGQTFFSSEALMERPETATFDGPPQAPRSFRPLRQLISIVRSASGTTPRLPLSEGTLTLKDGTRIGYKEYGNPEGTPVLYISGARGSRKEPMAFNLTRMKNARLIAVERYGNGLTTPKENPTVMQFADDMAEFLDLRVGRRTKVGIVGYSLGARFALACAVNAKIAPRVLRVGLVSPLGKTRRESDLANYPPDMQVLYRSAREHPHPIDGEAEGRLGIASKWPEGLRDDATWRDFYAQTIAKYKEDDRGILTSPGRPEALRVNWVTGYEQGGQGWISDIVMVTQRSPYSRQEIDVPIDIYHGTDDTKVPFDVGRAIYEALPRALARFFPYKGKGHFLIAEELGDIVNRSIQSPVRRPWIVRARAWVVNRRGSSSFAPWREGVILIGILTAFVLLLFGATFGLRGFTGHHVALLLPVQLVLGLPGVVIGSYVAYRLETRVIAPYVATIDRTRVKWFAVESWTFGVPVARFLFYGFLTPALLAYFGIVHAPAREALINTLVFGPLILAVQALYSKSRLMGRRGPLDATEEVKDSTKRTFIIQTIFWFGVLFGAAFISDPLLKFGAITVGTLFNNFFYIFPQRSPAFQKLERFNQWWPLRWFGIFYRWLFALLLYNRRFFGLYLGVMRWAALLAALILEGNRIGGKAEPIWDTAFVLIMGLFLWREMGPWRAAHLDINAAKNYVRVFLKRTRPPFTSFLRFDYPRNEDERVAHTQLIDYPIEPLLTAFRDAARMPKLENLRLIKIALTVNSRLSAFQKIRDLYGEFPFLHEALDEIFQSMQYTSLAMFDKAAGYWGRLIVRRTFRGRGDETHAIILDAMRRLHDERPAEKFEFADFAASDALITMELAEAAQKAGMDYVRFHASDIAHEFYTVKGLDPRSKDILVFDAQGHLLQATSPKGRLWVRWTLVDSYPSQRKRFYEKAVMWLNGTLRFGGRKVWIQKMEELYRIAKIRETEGTLHLSNGNGIEMTEVDLINPRARAFAARYPNLFCIDSPTDVSRPIDGTFHGARLWSLMMREGAYHTDAVINETLARIGESIVVGGVVVSGTKGTFENPHALIREVYLVNKDSLDLQPEYSAGHADYPASIPRHLSLAQREAA